MINQNNCVHFLSVKMDRLDFKRECILCKKVFDDEGVF